MARPKKATPTRKLHTSLPEPLMDRVDLVLYSQLEGRVPHGAYAELLTKLLVEWVKGLEAPNE